MGPSPRSKARRGRARLSPALATLAALLLGAAALAIYAEDAFFDADEFADRATAALDDQAVREEAATRITDEAILRADADLVAVRPIIATVADGIVGSAAFHSLFRAAVGDLHRTFFEHDADTVTLTVADIGSVVRGAVAALRPELAERIPPGLDTDLVDDEPPTALTRLAQVAEDVHVLAPLCLLAGLLAAALSVAVAGDRRQAAFRLGVAIMLVGVLAVAALEAARTIALDAVETPDIRAAAAGLWQAFLGDLRNVLLLFAVSGAVVAAAAASLLRAVEVNAPLRNVWRHISTPPASSGARIGRAVLLLAVGALVIAHPATALQAVAVLAGLYIAYAGVSELIGLAVADAPENEPAHRGRRRTLVAAGIAAATILLGGTALVATGGEDVDAPAPRIGCNGSEALCERPLDEVAFAGTHNAMSAVTNPGWLFGQQDDGFPGQLDDGVRALLIDAHYGAATEEGPVRTDLSQLSSGERATYQEELGSQALDAALRIRDRIVGSGTVEERGVYLCHRFCELGAVPIEEAFAQYRDFMAANAGEVLLVVIEDYVEPEDIEAAVKASGLDEYVYEGPLQPAPTLADVAAAGGVVMMAENDGGGDGIPWYHAAYEGLVQETPYSFDDPAALAQPSAWPASCKPNRGTRGAPMFLINHWVDTSPAPRLSNAREVNAREALLGRISECTRRRGQDANIVAVDFYRQGEVFEVVDHLNGVDEP